MKTSILALTAAVSLLTLTQACSHMPGSDSSDKDLAAANTGPAILNPRAEPGTVELNSLLQPKQRPEILADVKDYNANVKSVELRFRHVPIDVPMKNVGGTTWRATLSNEQLQNLAVGGKTVDYEAVIVARDDAGRIATTDTPVTLSIKTADLATAAG